MDRRLWVALSEMRSWIAREEQGEEIDLADHSD